MPQSLTESSSTPRTNPIKLITVKITDFRNELVVPGKPSQPSPTFAGKAGA